MEWGLFGEKALDFILTPIEEHKKIVILTGSVRSGKTVAKIPKWLEYVASIEGLKLIVGVSKDTVYDNVLNDLFDTLGSENYVYTSSNGILKIKYRDRQTGSDSWTVCKVIGAKDRGSEKYLRGKTLAGAYVDEGTLIPQGFFKQLLNRCSVEGARIFVTTNPDSPAHYIYNDYISNPKRSDIVEVKEFFLTDNPNLSKEYINFISNAYSGIEYERFVLGKWKVTEGLVVKGFSGDNVRDINYVRDEALHISCDFNVDPMCWVLAHKSNDKVF
jgi:PBSX family phage terminase large subunit